METKLAGTSGARSVVCCVAAVAVIVILGFARSATTWATAPAVLRVPEIAAGGLVADPKSIGAHPLYIKQAYVDQWITNTLHLKQAQLLSRGAGVTVAVVDTGVDTTHPALSGHLVPGYDFLAHTPSVTDPPGGPDSGHGTFIAGLIALVAPAAAIMPIRVLDPSGQGDEADVADGIKYAVDHGARIINLSLGSYTDSVAVDSAVLYARQHGVVVVAASGNDNTQQPEYPAATSGVLAVAATDRTDRKATFSNFGRYIGLSAPGVDLYSAYNNGAYASGAGTSFATPLVAGVLALVWGIHRGESPGELTSGAAHGSVELKDLNRAYENSLGAGRIDALATLMRR